MPDLDPAPRILAIRLGLGDLDHTVCHGYANGCVCETCAERVLLVREAREEPFTAVADCYNTLKHRQIRQPWELAA